VHAVFGDRARVTVVVGYKHDMIMEEVPDVLYAYNEDYEETNTSKSLLKALRLSPDGAVIWMNGDVVFHATVLRRLEPFLERDESAIAVNTAATAEEEVKYTVDEHGRVRQLSKQVADALGEAVGINLVAGRDKDALIARLADCDDQDYFERGIELAIAHDSVQVTPVDISDLFAVEVDFADDLERAIAARRNYEEDGGSAEA
jgi:choline kinase